MCVHSTFVIKNNTDYDDDDNNNRLVDTPNLCSPQKKLTNTILAAIILRYA